MSASDHSLPDDGLPDREGLAAEYVLGTLPLADRAAAERLIASDPDFAAAVVAWQNRLAPLNDGYAPLPPPADMFARIEARLFPTPAKGRSWLRVWLGALAGAAVVASLVFILLPQIQGPAEIVATLKGDNQPLVVAAHYAPDAKRLVVRRDAGPAAAAGKDYELWVIPAGQDPISLGVLREADLSVELATLPAGSTLAITLEAEGGSPTGKPQGPLLVAAVIAG